jgi:hypothetical protein
MEVDITQQQLYEPNHSQCQNQRAECLDDKKLWLLARIQYAILFTPNSTEFFALY